MTTGLVSCPACGRKNASDRTTCLSCGADLPVFNASEQKQVTPPWAVSLWQRIKKVRLNGWQRLWLVISVLWFLVVAFFTYGSLEHEARYLSLRATRTYTIEIPGRESILFKAEEGLTPEEVWNRWLESPSESRYQAALKEQYRPSIVQRARDLVLQVATIFLIWGVPCSVLYAIGWAIAWVRRGFRTP